MPRSSKASEPGGPRPENGSAAVEAVRLLLLAGTATAVVRYLLIAHGTLGYPFQLEWMEGGVVDVVERVCAGQPLYVAPSVSYVPFIYPPVYFWLTAGVAETFGDALFAGRLVSFVSILGVGALAWKYAAALGAAARRWAFLAPGLLAVAYEAGGRWYHLARVDSLALVLAVGALVVLRTHRGSVGAVCAGLLSVAAVATKQTSVLLLAPALVVAACQGGWRSGAAALVGTLALLFAGAAATNGWALYYLVELPSQHDLAPTEAAAYLGEVLIWWLPALVLAVGGVFWRVRHGEKRAWLDAAVLFGLAASSLIALAHTGSYVNVLVPLFVALAVFTPLGIACLLDRLDGSVRAWVVTACGAALVVQAVGLGEPMSRSLPARGAEARGVRFLDWVGGRDGEVLLPEYRGLQARVGKRSFGLGMAARDVLRASRDDRGRRMLEASLAEALGTQRFRTVVTARRDWLGGALELGYRLEGEIAGPPTTVTGADLRPRWVWVPE